MEDKIQLLTDILQTRVRYMRAWNAVDVFNNKSKFTIKWHEWMGEPNNTALFQEVTYPIEMLDTEIRKQRDKLKKDIPECERNVLKSVL